MALGFMPHGAARQSKSIILTNWRQALQDAYNTAMARGVPVTLPTYSTTPAPGAVLTVADIAEPRSWVVNLENK